MTESDRPKVNHSMEPGQRIKRIRRAKEMRDKGLSHHEICKKMEITRGTLKRYIADFHLLDGAKKQVKKAAPKVRKCLHCGYSFRPNSRFRFMCDSCNNFTRGAML